MKKQGFYIKIYSAFIVSLVLMLTGCKQMSEKTTDTSVGLNGGFEISKNGLPVNWLIYTPKTVPTGDFEILLDKENYKEGNQSLKFIVRECASSGGWGSPGFTNEFFEVGKFEGKSSYKLGFWIKNDGARFRVSGGGVSPFEGEMNILIENDEQIDDWKFLEYEIDVPEDRHLRMELNILEPGTFWIDAIKIEKK